MTERNLWQDDERKELNQDYQQEDRQSIHKNSEETQQKSVFFCKKNYFLYTKGADSMLFYSTYTKTKHELLVFNLMIGDIPLWNASFRRKYSSIRKVTSQKIPPKKHR